MKSIETIRKTFAEETKMNPKIIRVFADINKNSLTSFRKQKQASQKFFQILSRPPKEPKLQETK